MTDRPKGTSASSDLLREAKEGISADREPPAIYESPALEEPTPVSSGRHGGQGGDENLDAASIETAEVSTAAHEPSPTPGDEPDWGLPTPAQDGPEAPTVAEPVPPRPNRSETVSDRIRRASVSTAADESDETRSDPEDVPVAWSSGPEHDSMSSPVEAVPPAGRTRPADDGSASEPVTSDEPPILWRSPDEPDTWTSPGTPTGGGFSGFGRGGAWWLRRLVPVAFLVFFGITWLVDLTDGKDPIDSIAVGSCFIVGEALEVEQVEVLDCSETHDAELFATVEIIGFSSHPGDDALWDWMYDACVDEFPAYVGEPYETSEYWIDTFIPTESGWSDGDRTGMCTIVVVDDDLNIRTSTGSARGAGRDNA